MATQTISNVLEIDTGKRQRIVELPFEIEPENDGLGCIRGFAFAMLFNVVLALTIFGAWEIWKHLR